MSLLIDALKDRGSPELVRAVKHFWNSEISFSFEFGRGPESNMLALKAVLGHHLEKVSLDLILRGADGTTPLMLACQKDYRSAAREIASLLPDLEAVNGRGRTALSIAVMFSSLKMVQMLVRMGASVHTMDGQGCSVFF
jgi:hypothetical protein